MSAAAPKLELRGLSKHFGELEVLRDLSLQARAGEFVAILGPSGCGKSTAFAILTGGTPASGGEVLVDGAPDGVPAGHFAYMPQADALLPWRRVLDNATLGLEVRGMARREARERVRPLLPTFGLDGFESSFPFQLSGGMRQRAALLRTVVQECEVLLLDEPFGALDALTRAEMQRWLESVWAQFRWTVRPDHARRARGRLPGRPRVRAVPAAGDGGRRARRPSPPPALADRPATGSARDGAARAAAQPTEPR